MAAAHARTTTALLRALYAGGLPNHSVWHNLELCTARTFCCTTIALGPAASKAWGQACRMAGGKLLPIDQ